MKREEINNGKIKTLDEWIKEFEDAIENDQEFVLTNDECKNVLKLLKENSELSDNFMELREDFEKLSNI